MNNTQQIVRRLNDTQRKGLIGIIEKRIDKRLEHARRQEEKLRDKIEEEIRRERGVDMLVKDWEKLDKQITKIELAAKERGFDIDAHGSCDPLGSVHTEIIKRVKQQSDAIAEIEMLSDRIKKSILLSDTVAEAERSFTALSSGENIPRLKG